MPAYAPPLHIPVINAATLVDDREVAFWVEAVRQQLAIAANDWGFAAPGMALYSGDAAIPVREGLTITIVDDGGDPDAAGFHTPYSGVVDLRRSTAPDRTLSHEALEILGNQMLDRWFIGPGGLDYAGELCDGVERQEYSVKVELFGVSHEVELSDFLLPSWFTVGGQPPFSHLRSVHAPFELGPGGYSVARNANGDIVYMAHKDGSFLSPAKLSPLSRTHRLVTAPF